jgi:hypothetical protein
VSFLGLLLYVSLDFANPLMPGAVCFDPDRSVDGVGRARVCAVVSLVLVGFVETTPTMAPPRSIALRASTPVTVTGGLRFAPRARTHIPFDSEGASEEH